MKYLLPAALLGLTVACGNPHITSTKSGIERVSPPALRECPAVPTVSGYEVFFASSSPETFDTFIACKNIFTEDFNFYPDGVVPELTNDGRVAQPFILTHQSEVAHDPDKIETVEDVFGIATYDFTIENPVEYNGVMGADRGADTGSVGTISSDALVWEFKTGISFFSVKPVGLSNNATLRLFNCSKELVKTVNVPASPRFIGFISETDSICTVSLSASGGADAVAVDEFLYGN